MKITIFLVAIIFPFSFAIALNNDEEASIRLLIHFSIVSAQVQYCKDELLKLGSPTEVPVFLDSRDPNQAKKRFSSNTLLPQEEVAFSEFNDYCLPLNQKLERMSKILKSKP